jgi:23S rRNA (guanine1835-N2)-methyltransferase
MPAEELCPTPFGDFILRRPLPDRTGALRAWDGADLLLLDHVFALAAAMTTGSPAEATVRVLIIGDSFGALTVALNQFSPTIFSDSIVSEHAIDDNRTENHCEGQVQFVADGDELRDAEPYDLIVWNVDRATDVVAQVASMLSPLSHDRTVVFAAGLDKHLPPRTADILRSVGDVTTHPGRRKAHLFEVRVTPGTEHYRPIEPPASQHVEVREHDLILTGSPGVFSADRFDVGTRLLAAQLDWLATDRPDALDIVDLGCGNGALGVIALRLWPDSRIHFLDESGQAVAAARRNVVANVGEAGLARARFVRSDVFEDLAHTNVDLVLCNPPFHHANAMNDEVAWQMFLQSHRRLRPGGEMWVVGNRHLGYHDKLRRVFAAVSQLDAHPKFVVLAARK